MPWCGLRRMGSRKRHSIQSAICQYPWYKGEIKARNHITSLVQGTAKSPSPLTSPFGRRREGKNMNLLHIRIQRKADLYRNPGEIVLNLSEDELKNRFLQPYEAVSTVVANGAVIPIEEIHRVQIKASDVAIPAPCDVDEYHVFKDIPNDVMDEFITKPPGHNVVPKAAADSSRSGRDVFISHAGTDKGIAVRIAEYLENAGWTTWYYERDSVAGPRHLEQTGIHIGC